VHIYGHLFPGHEATTVAAMDAAIAAGTGSKPDDVVVSLERQRRSWALTCGFPGGGEGI
jgi:hypothetical protein